MFQNSTPDKQGGDGTYTGPAGEVTQPNYTLSRGAFGGKDVSMRHLRSFANNQRYGRNVWDIVTWRNVIPSNKEIGITTRTFATELGPVINTIPGSTPERGRTKPLSAILNKNSQTFLRFKQDFRRERGIIRRDKTVTNISQRLLNSTHSLKKQLDIRGARRNIRSQKENIKRWQK